MTDETSTLEQGGGEVLPQQPAPRSDAEADLQEQATAQQAQPDAEAKLKEEAEQKRRNKTREYIERLQQQAGEAGELKRRLQDLETRLPKAPKPKEPKLEDFDFNTAEYAKALVRWENQQFQKQQGEAEAAQAQQRTQQETITTYQQRAAAYAETVEDFLPVVTSIPRELMPDELEAALLAHERGPELAYKLALDEDALFNLAGLRPELMARAVERYASRMSAAPVAPAQPAEPPALAQAPTKPITQAPQPAPRVSGRAPASVPADKLTDEEWERQRRDERARGRN